MDHGQYIQDKCSRLNCGRDDRDHTLVEEGDLWICPICEGSYGAGKKKTFQEELSEELNGNDYDRGKLEELDETADRLRAFCATLGAALVEKGLFTEDEVMDFVHGG